MNSLKFSDKLDYLMSITNTTNSILARSIPLDPSFVSRLRNGRRTPAKNENYIEKIASYFTKGIVNNYQKAALCEVLDLDIKTLPDSQEAVKTLLIDWLQKEHTNCYQAIETILDGVSTPFFEKNVSNHSDDVLTMIDGGTVNTTILYGNKGRQSIIKSMLLLLIKSKAKHPLYWVNEDSITWLTDDISYRNEISLLLRNVLHSGKKIIMVHTLHRTQDEMYALLEIWIPLYVTGKCEAYFYPKLRDGLVKNSIFVVPKTAALISLNCSSDLDCAANFMLTEHKLLKHLEHEYKSYLSQCTPLLETLTQESIEKQYELLYEFEQRKADCILKADMLSSLTLSEDTLSGFIERIDSNQRAAIYEKQKIRKQNFVKFLKHYVFTELIVLPSVQDIQNNLVKINLSHLLGYNEIYYTTEEFIAHITETLEYIKNYPNYNLILLEEDILANCIIYSKKNVGTFLANAESPFSLFFIKELSVSNSTWDYLSYKTGEDDPLIIQKNDTINKLTNLLEILISENN